MPVDQVLLTLYNPQTAGGLATVQVLSSGVNSWKQVRIHSTGSAELGLQPTNGGKTPLVLRVHANVPIIAQRVVIKGGTTQSAYGIPEPDTHAT
jgi:hypothetical protein